MHTSSSQSSSQSKFINKLVSSQTAPAHVRVREGSSKIRDPKAYFKAWRIANFGEDFDPVSVAVSEALAEFSSGKPAAARESDRRIWLKIANRIGFENFLEVLDEEKSEIRDLKSRGRTPTNPAASFQKLLNRPTSIIAGGDYNVYVGFKDDLSERTIVSRQLVVKVEPMPNPHVMASIAQPGQEAGIISFDEENKPVITGTDLGDPEEVWLDVFPDGYAAGADLTYRLKDELEELESTATTITFLLFDNQSEHPARDFKGKLARVYAKYADGFTSYVNATFRA